VNYNIEVSHLPPSILPFQARTSLSINQSKQYIYIYRLPEVFMLYCVDFISKLIQIHGLRYLVHDKDLLQYRLFFLLRNSTKPSLFSEIATIIITPLFVSIRTN